MKNKKCGLLILMAILSVSLKPLSVSARLVCPPPLDFRIGSTSIFEYCAFDSMPLFDQTNPNLAYVNVPEAAPGQLLAINSACAVSSSNYLTKYPDRYPTYNCEHSPAPDHYIHDHDPQPNPYIKSWLPWGPFPGDPGSLPWKRKNIYGTLICAPTSEAMALNAEISSRDPNTYVVPNSWTDLNFVQALKPAFQNDWPDPLYATNLSTDPTNPAGERSGYQMTRSQLQQVVNMALLQETDPSNGGFGDAIEGLTSDFASPTDRSKVYDANNPISEGKSVNINNAHLIELLGKGYASVIGIHYYEVHIEDAGGNPSIQKITLLPQPGGHVLAIEGYNKLNNTVTQIIHDPLFGVRRMESLPDLTAGSFTVLGAQKTYTMTPQNPSDSLPPLIQGSETRTLVLPPGLLSVMVVPWEPPYWDFGAFTSASPPPSEPPPPVNSIWYLRDKEIITLVDELRAFYVP